MRRFVQLFGPACVLVDNDDDQAALAAFRNGSRAKIMLLQVLAQQRTDFAIVIDNEHRCTLIQYVKQFKIDPVFAFSPTISAYREHVLKKALPDTFMGPRLDDFIQRRNVRLQLVN